MTNKLQDLYEKHVFMGMRKQRHFAALLGQHTWQYDKPTGTMQFTPGPTYAVQLLGTESAETDSWMWAWANPESEIPPPQLQACLRLRDLGQEWGVEEFTTPQLPREQLPAHLLGPVAMGVLDLPAYYRGALEQRNLLALISDPAYAELPPLHGTAFVTTLGDAISSCNIPRHREAVAQFIQQLGWQGRWTDEGVQVEAADGVTVTARFDGLNRLCKLSTQAAQPA